MPTGLRITQSATDDGRDPILLSGIEGRLAPRRVGDSAAETRSTLASRSLESRLVSNRLAERERRLSHEVRRKEEEDAERRSIELTKHRD